MKNPTSVDSKQLQELESMVGNFPFCNLGHVLVAKGNHDQELSTAKDKLKQAASYSSNRTKLRSLIHATPKKVDIPALKEDQTAVTEVIEEKKKLEDSPKPSPEAKIEPSEIKTPENESIEVIEENTESVSETTNTHPTPTENSPDVSTLSWPKFGVPDQTVKSNTESLEENNLDNTTSEVKKEAVELETKDILEIVEEIDISKPSITETTNKSEPLVELDIELSTDTPSILKKSESQEILDALNAITGDTPKELEFEQPSNFDYLSEVSNINLDNLLPKVDFSEEEAQPEENIEPLIPGALDMAYGIQDSKSGEAAYSWNELQGKGENELTNPPEKMESSNTEKDIINSFLKKNPKIKSVKELSKTEEIQDLSKANSSKFGRAVTETMANIYLAQGNVKKAKGIFEKLILLFPEKKAYFAKKLREINE